MLVKDSKTVGLGIWHPALVYAIDVVDFVWRKHTGTHPRITGLSEEGHSEFSRHYGIAGDVRCLAIDIDADDAHLVPGADISDDVRRLNTPAVQKAIDNELKERLGTDFKLLWEFMGTVRAHLHLAYARKP